MTANMSKCSAVQFSDQMSCSCGNVWDMNDPYPPECKKEPTMTTNKPEVLPIWKAEDVWVDEERVVRLSAYEALQAECERWKNAASGAHQQLTANRIETERLAVDWSKAMAECEKLRKDAERYRWLQDNCEMTADEYGTAGQLYFGTYQAGRLDEAIDAAMEGAASEGS